MVEDEANNQGGIGSFIQQAVRMFCIWNLLQFVLRMFVGDKTREPELSDEELDDFEDLADVPDQPSKTRGGVHIHKNLWADGEEFDLKVYLTEEEEFNREEIESYTLAWDEQDLVYSWDAPTNERNKTIAVPLDSELQNNGSGIWAHCFATISGSLDNDNGDVLYSKKQLVVKRKLKRVVEKKKLLGGSESQEPRAKDSLNRSEDIIVNHFIPQLPFVVVHDFQTFRSDKMQPEILEAFEINPENHGYKPIHYVDSFWVLKDDDEDAFVKLLVEANPYLLATTMVVTILHMVFDCLAFKNDIQFWRNTKSMEGLSVRTVFLNCFIQVVVFLYLVENNTNYMILISNGVGMVIEFWKITQVSDVTFHQTGGRFGPWIEVKDKDSYSGTKKFDREAMKYLSWVMYPLLLSYAVYSLLYDEHKGWYSYILGTLVGFVYMFGFIMMCPQLYLNYKLKSVAHLPWRMLTYKFLNTIIDDLFAFLITMPTLHRISCFRDDVVFLIFLYQKWIYPVDMKRANEYGLIPKDKDGTTAVEGGATAKEKPALTGPELERSNLVEEMEFLNKELRVWEQQAERRGAGQQDFIVRIEKYNAEYGEFHDLVKTLDWKSSLNGGLPEKLLLDVDTLQILPLQEDISPTIPEQSSSLIQKEESPCELLDESSNLPQHPEGLRKRNVSADG